SRVPLRAGRGPEPCLSACNGESAGRGYGTLQKAGRCVLLLALSQPSGSLIMSLHPWEWEDDKASLGPMSSMINFYQSWSECEVEEYLKAKARGQESDSDNLPSSLASSDGPASTFASDIPQVVPCKFIISLALPSFAAVQRAKHLSLIDKFKRSKVDRPLTKSRRFYHIEYFLLPDDGEPKKADVVVFPTVAKVFLDSGVKTVKLWQEGNKAWVSWAQTFHISMTKELLKKLNFFRITLRLWDTKDKVPRKVRYYRLKTPVYSDDTGSFDEVKNLVLSQRKLPKQDIRFTQKWNQEYVPGEPEAAEQLKSPRESDVFSNDLEDEKLFRMEDPGFLQWSGSRRMSSSIGLTGMEPSVSSLTSMLEKQKVPIRLKELEGKKKVQKKSRSVIEEETNTRPVGTWRPETFSMQLAVMPLLAGWQTVVSHGSLRSANILDCFLTLKTEVPIMTEEQKQDLNPLTIKIHSISCLPSQPVPIDELARLCTPVYCRYQFQNLPAHRTEGQRHGTHIYFQDVNVIFLGAMHPRDLREYLEGPPMVVEVHDRDRKLEESSQKPTLFGEDPFDTHLSLHTLITPKEIENNPFDSQNNVRDPYGVAQVSFADLLLGYTYLNLVVPVHSCEPGPTNLGRDSRSRKAVGFRAPPGGLQHAPMPMGNYLEADSQLKLRVDVAVPLRARPDTPELDLRGTEFGRVVFVFNARKPALLRSLLQDVAMVNARALELDVYPLRNIQQILSAFRMRAAAHDRPELDVLTGFHLLDGRLHLLVLEGLAEQGLRWLWESHQRRVTRLEHSVSGKHKVLYNSRLLFRHRLYADLETMLYHVHLFRPLSLLVKQPALYLRNAVSRQAFQALSRVYCICHHSTRLREVVTRDLLPSSTMIEVLNQEFGLPISPRELTDRKPTLPPQPVPIPEPSQGHISVLSHDISTHKKRYLQWRRTMKLNKDQSRSFIQVGLPAPRQNIAGAYQASKKPVKPVVKVLRISAPARGTIHNYSIQTLNSVALAKKELHREMAKDPRKRFTYSQKYLSATVEPQDPEEEDKKAKKKSRQAWLTPTGFQVTGLQCTGSDPHLRLLPPGFLTEQNEVRGEERAEGGASTKGRPPHSPSLEWREKAPSVNVLDRERWSWDRRHQDFDLYKKPPPFLELPPPLKPVAGPVGTSHPVLLRIGLRTSPRRVDRLAENPYLLGQQSQGLCSGRRRCSLATGEPEKPLPECNQRQLLLARGPREGPQAVPQLPTSATASGCDLCLGGKQA
ncbi:LOW QUALITY PROTEIN: hypothetical protein J0S82_013514, partial [Galemys pyrenaicus]